MTENVKSHWTMVEKSKSHGGGWQKGESPLEEDESTGYKDGGEKIDTKKVPRKRKNQREGKIESGKDGGSWNVEEEKKERKKLGRKKWKKKEGKDCWKVGKRKNVWTSGGRIRKTKRKEKRSLILKNAPKKKSKNKKREISH